MDQTWAAAGVFRILRTTRRVLHACPLLFFLCARRDLHWSVEQKLLHQWISWRKLNWSSFKSKEQMCELNIFAFHFLFTVCQRVLGVFNCAWNSISFRDSQEVATLQNTSPSRYPDTDLRVCIQYWICWLHPKESPSYCCCHHSLLPACAPGALYSNPLRPTEKCII